VTFAYSNRNWITSTTDVHGKVVAMTYDAAGNRSALKLDAVNFSTYIYDFANRLTKITNSSDAKAVNYAYDNANRMTTKTLPNGVATIYNYDGMSRLTRLKDAKGATVLYDKQYAYNGSSQISQIADLTQTKNFGYDNVDRLTGVTGSSTENYAFDSVGNRTSSSLSATYAYQPNNRLTNTATASYAYNINGNMTSMTDTSGTTNYVWDYENRLKQATKPNGTVVNFKYDALSRRSERNVNGTVWTKFTYDGQDVMLDQNSDGTTVRYLNGLGIDNKLRMQNGTTVSYFLSDHLGSTTAQTDATGNITNSASYDGFGNSTNNLLTRYQFTGREVDADLGVQYNRARFYDAKLGRFISEDPIGFRGGTANLFEYVNGNPIMGTDPTGEIPLWDNYWHWYYTKKCGESGIAAACAINGNDQTQAGLERMAQQAFDSGTSSFSGLRFKVGYGDNPNCRKAEEYAANVFGDSFPTAVHMRAAPIGLKTEGSNLHLQGDLLEDAKRVAKPTTLGFLPRAWNYVKSWF
jgi:RHS repeat-associated protein